MISPFLLNNREFPPIITVPTYLQNLFHSQSIFIYHDIAGVPSIIDAGKNTVKLGGKGIKVFLALLYLLI